MHLENLLLDPPVNEIDEDAVDRYIEDEEQEDVEEEEEEEEEEGEGITNLISREIYDWFSDQNQNVLDEARDLIRNLRSTQTIGVPRRRTVSPIIETEQRTQAVSPHPLIGESHTTTTQRRGETLESYLLFDQSIFRTANQAPTNAKWNDDGQKASPTVINYALSFEKLLINQLRDATIAHRINKQTKILQPETITTPLTTDNQTQSIETISTQLTVPIPTLETLSPTQASAPVITPQLDPLPIITNTEQILEKSEKVEITNEKTEIKPEKIEIKPEKEETEIKPEKTEIKPENIETKFEKEKTVTKQEKPEKTEIKPENIETKSEKEKNCNKTRKNLQLE